MSVAPATRTVVALTADQRKVLLKLKHFAAADDWRSVANLECAGNAVADAVRITMAENAAYVYCILGNAFFSLGRFGKAIEYHTKELAIAKELGSRLEEGRAYGNLGGVYEAQGDFVKAIEYQMQDLEISKELGTQAEEGTALGNLGVAYQGHGDFGKAIEFHTQHLAIAKELGDKTGECRAYLNLGICHIHLSEYAKAVGYFKAQHTLADEPFFSLDSKGLHVAARLARLSGPGALGMGVALRLQIRADRQGPAAGASQAPGPHSYLSASVCLEDRVSEAEKWLKLALKFGQDFAQLHLAYLFFDSGDEDAALAHLKEHLSRCVQAGHGDCAGCGQMRAEDTPMLTCGHCRVARFCGAYCQQMASKKAALGGSWFAGRHKDICGVLSKWRQAAKDDVAPDSCKVDLLAFLQR